MEIATYLHFNGNCGPAFAHYEKVLGGKVTMKMTFADSPVRDQTPAEMLGHIMHITLAVGKQALMGSDAPPQHFNKPQGFSASISVSTKDEAERIYNALSEGAQSISMAFQKTFWSEGFGMFVDKFGIPWMVGVAQA